MNYFNVSQIQRIKDKFPVGTKGKEGLIELTEVTPRIHRSILPQRIVIKAIEQDRFNIVFDTIDNNVVKFNAFFESIDNYNEPSETQFKTVEEEVEEELTNALRYKTKVKVEVVAYGKEPNDISSGYWGELETPAKYKMIIEVNLNSPL